MTVVCFKWKPKTTYRSTFGPQAVNVLRNMVARHYPDPHRFVCITDDPTGIAEGIEIVPLWSDFSDVQNPHGAHQPSCYRRLKLFAPDIGEVLGDTRFVVIDLDTVITGDVRALWNRPEDFVIWGETDPRSWYNGSMFLMTAGARRQVLERFDPAKSPLAAKSAGRFGSDQGWISYVLGPGEAMWSRKDGVYSYRVHLQPNKSRLPDNARIVMFHGRLDPWSPELRKVDWIREHYQ